MTIRELTLGPRPEEPGPPIGGRESYPADVVARLAADAATIIARYPQPRSALLPLLHLVQSEDGYLTKAGIAFCASQLDLSDAEVAAVGTFYSMYRRTETGEYLVGVCTNTLCAIMGGDAILEALENDLGVARRADHRRRPDHPRAHRVQRGVRLRAGGDGQLGVLRQPNPLECKRTRHRTAGGRARRTHPRCRTVLLPRDRADTGRRRTAMPSTPACRAMRPSPACGSPRRWREDGEQ